MGEQIFQKLAQKTFQKTEGDGILNIGGWALPAELIGTPDLSYPKKKTAKTGIDFYVGSFLPEKPLKRDWHYCIKPPQRGRKDIFIKASIKKKKIL